MEGESYYRLRRSNKLNYNLLDKFGRTPAKAIHNMANKQVDFEVEENPGESELNQDSEDGIQTNEVMDRPIEGNLMDPQYWDKVKTDYDREVKKVEANRILAERQAYLVQRKKVWIDSNRRLKILQMEAERLDKAECIADKRFKEKVKLATVRKGKN